MRLFGRRLTLDVELDDGPGRLLAEAVAGLAVVDSGVVAGRRGEGHLGTPDRVLAGGELTFLYERNKSN